MSDFYQTKMGHKFYEGDVPRIVDALEKIAKELKRLNDREERPLPNTGPK